MLAPLRYCGCGHKWLPGLVDGTERRHLHCCPSSPQVPSRGAVRTAQEPVVVSVTRNSTRATASPGWFSSDSAPKKHPKSSGANVKSGADWPIKASLSGDRPPLSPPPGSWAGLARLPLRIAVADVLPIRASALFNQDPGLQSRTGRATWEQGAGLAK